MSENGREYPRTVALGNDEVELRLMGAGDRDAVLAFAGALSRHDLLFLRRDITQAVVVDRWLADIEEGRITTILAEMNGALVGYGTIHRSELEWSAHVAELRILVAAEARGQGLGRLLTQEIFAVALAAGIEKMVARMTIDQRSAIRTFEGLGFHAEALLRDHVKDLSGETHDLVMMSLPVEEFHRTLEAYGVGENLGANP